MQNPSPPPLGYRVAVVGVVLLLNEMSKDSATNGIDLLACPAGPQLSSAVQACDLCSSEAITVIDSQFTYPASLWLSLDQTTSAKITKGGNRQALGRGYSRFSLTLVDTPWVVTPPWARTCEMTAGTLALLAPHPNAHLTWIYKEPRSGEQCFGKPLPCSKKVECKQQEHAPGTALWQGCF